MPLSRSKFNEIIVDAIRRSGWSEVYLGRLSAHPFRVGAVSGDKSRSLAVYSWSVTHGGASRSANEFRIQVQVTEFVILPDVQTLVLGWWSEAGLFAAFDIQKHHGKLGNNASIQVSRATLNAAVLNGLAVQTGKGNQEVVAAFRPEYFMTYVENMDHIHNFGTSSAAIDALIQALDPAIAPTQIPVGALSAERQLVIQTVRKRVREANFREKVLRAYDHECAMCNIQLELVDAAHIVPVAAPASTDDTDNGMALCALHHRAYDAALVTVNADYSIAVSDAEIGRLRGIGHHGGLDEFVDGLRDIINVPPNVHDRPRPEYLNRGKTIRGWR
ncbi:MAG TPA: HNH endonuclease [Tepidisphaeraceae bacterium]|nr:HNH endonuclease [Tepidisphaeraceae bacterium]